MFRFITKRTIGAVIIILIIACIFTAPVSAFNTTKIGDKGLDPQLNGDRHNSYSWCMGILHHSDGDYLYVGSNRDMAYLVVSGLFKKIDTDANFGDIKVYIESFFGGDIATYASPAAVDLQPMILRLKLSATNGSW